MNYARVNLIITLNSSISQLSPDMDMTGAEIYNTLTKYFVYRS